MAFCGNCGAQIKAGNRFCVNCGAEVPADRSGAEVPTGRSGVGGSGGSSGVMIPSGVSGENGAVPNNGMPGREAKPLPVQPSVYGRQVPGIIVQPPKEEKNNRSFPWMFAGIGALVLGIFGWAVDSVPATIAAGIVSLVLAILALIKKGKLRAFPIIAIVVSGVLLIGWGIQGLIDLKAYNKPDRTVKLNALEMTIPGYYQYSSSKSSGEYRLYSTRYTTDEGYLGVMCVDIYKDEAELAETMRTQGNLIYDLYKDELDELLNNELDTLILGSFDELDNGHATYVEDRQLGGLNGRKYEFSGMEEGKHMIGECVCAIDVIAGRLCLVVIYQEEDSKRNYLADLDRILDSAKYSGSTDSFASSSGGVRSGNGTSPVSGGVTLEFKKTMDAYEEFFDEYVELIENYDSSTDALALLGSYTEMLSKYADMMTALESIDTNSLSAADYAYYMEVYGRIMQKLASVSY